MTTQSDIKQTRFTYVMFYVVAIALAVLARIGIAVLDAMGGISYDYISTTSGTLSDQLLSIFSGAQLFGFMGATAFMSAVFIAAVIMRAVGYSKDPGSASLARVIVFGFITALVGLLCFVVIISGLFSGVQIWGLKIAAPVTAGVIVMGVVALIAFGTLIAAATEAALLCVATARGEKGLQMRILIVAAIIGAIVVLLTVLTFSALDAAKIDAVRGSIWFGVDALVNVGMIVVAHALIASKRKKG